LYFRWMMSFVVSVASSVIWRVHTIHKAMGLMKGSIKHCNDSYWSLLNLSKTAGINIWMQYSFHIEYRARTQPSIHPFFLCMVVTLDCQLSSLCSTSECDKPDDGLQQTILECNMKVFYFIQLWCNTSRCRNNLGKWLWPFCYCNCYCNMQWSRCLYAWVWPVGDEETLTAVFPKWCHVAFPVT
jgi:hypothetical protein